MFRDIITWVSTALLGSIVRSSPFKINLPNEIIMSINVRIILLS